MNNHASDVTIKNWPRSKTVRDAIKAKQAFAFPTDQACEKLIQGFLIHINMRVSRMVNRHKHYLVVQSRDLMNFCYKAFVDPNSLIMNDPIDETNILIVTSWNHTSHGTNPPLKQTELHPQEKFFH